MARPLRIEFEGALYHVTARGNAREEIYLTDEDRELFLVVFGEVCAQFNWQCHAYCLMSNHYHLVVETPESNLSLGMRQLNGVYTQKFNRKHSRTGHIFQGRYKAILVEKQAYLLELSRYVVLNPVRAQMVRHAKDWPWSSYRATAGQVDVPLWLNADWLLGMFSNKKGAAIKKYIAFVESGKGLPSPWQELKNQIYLGSEAFVETILEQVECEKVLSEVPSAQRRPVAKPLADYEGGEVSRDTAICAAYASGSYSLKEIADYFGLHYSWVSRLIAKNKT